MVDKIEYISENDVLNAGREKINKFAIDPAMRAESNSIDAKNIADEANRTSSEAKDIANNTDGRLNNIIAGEMNDAEVIDARRPFGSEAYQTLGERLDSEKAEITAQLEQNTHNVINPIKLGAVGDNSTDNYTALNEMFLKASSEIVYDMNLSSNSFTTKTIDIPTGIYRVKQANLLAGLPTKRFQSLVINGNGATIVFEGFGGNCLELNDNLLNVDFYNVNFISLNDIAADNRTLFKNTSNGGTQSVKFHQCTFQGVMKYAFDLFGGNTNSEMAFNQCGMFGKWDSFLHIGETNTSDQFLNYWFNNCRYWNSSNFITAYKGGHFKLTNCDISGFSPTSDTYLFKLMGTSHAYGVTTFIDNGTRYELKSSYAKVLWCEWDTARISFENVDMGSNAFNVIPRESVFYLRNATSGSDSNYSFENCILLGKFVLNNGNNSKCNNLYLKECCLLGDSNTSMITDIFTYQKGVNASEFFKVNLINTKYGEEIYNTVLNRLDSSYSWLKQNIFLQQNSSGLLDSNWQHGITGTSILDELTVLTRERIDGNTYVFAVKSDTGATVSAVDTTSNSVTLNSKIDVYPNNKVTFGTSNTIYTVKDYDYQSNQLYLNESLSGVFSGSKVEFAIVEVNFIPMHYPRQLKNETKYVLTNKLYLKSYGASFPAAGVSARIFVKTIE